MSYFEHTKRDLERAINLAIEETLTEVIRKIRELPPSSSTRDPFPWRTGRDEALGAATKVGIDLIKTRVHTKLTQ
jgi:hypothetical protein